LRRSHAVILGLVTIYLIAVSLRLLPTLQTGLLYTYDSWEDAGRVLPALKTGFFPKILPHGPLFYIFMLQWCLVSGMTVFETFLWSTPFLSSTLVFSVFLLTRGITGNIHAGLFASLFAATSSFLLHWTATPVPEAIGLTYIIFIILLLYQTISKSSSRYLLMFVVCYLAAVLTHHLTPFLFLTGLSVLGVYAFFTKRRDWWRLLPLLLALSLIPTTFVWWDLAIADWTIGVMERILLVASPLLAFALAVVVILLLGIFYVADRMDSFPLSEGRELIFASSVAGVTALLLLVATVSLAGQTNFDLPLGYVFIYGASHMGLIYFPTWLGFVLYFNREVEPWKRVFSLSWCLGTYSINALLTFASFWFVISYRTFSFLILVGLPLLGQGYSHLSKIGLPRWRPIQGIAIAYLAVLLVPLAFPSAGLAFGSDEFYKDSEYLTATWIDEHTVGQTILDSDHRMGKLLRYATGHFTWLGNESSWIGGVTQTAKTKPMPSSIEYLIITSTMIDHLVTDGVEQQGRPVTPGIMEYLNSSPTIDRIYSSDHTMTYRNRRYSP